jgi:MerR family redox-sensitive transcriptional activator SoxR
VAVEHIFIGELSRRSGASTSAIRFYERRGLIAPVNRVSGRRVYEPAAVHRLAVIQLCARAGFRLEEIAALLDAPRQRRATLAASKRTELNETIRVARKARRLLDALMDCGCTDLDRCELVPSPKADR